MNLGVQNIFKSLQQPAIITPEGEQKHTTNREAFDHEKLLIFEQEQWTS